LHHAILLEPPVWVRDLAEAWQRIHRHTELIDRE
jgi:hypothetical protein